MEASEGDLASRGYGAVLWEPDDRTVRNARVTHFIRWLASRGTAAGGYQDLWQWSVTQPGEFWTAVWDYFDVLGDRGDGPALAGAMPEVRWFEGATLNYARNALRTAWTDPSRTAIIFSSERRQAGSLTYGELAAQVARVARGLRSLGVGRGDRVAALLPNVPEAVIGLLAAASLGAIWSSCSPDFGARSVIDRFAQIEPKVLIACDGYAYNGKEYSRAQLLDEVLAELPGPPAVVMVHLLGEPTATPGAVRWDDLGAEGDQHEPEFEEVPFAHPLWVVYSSGTTGLPKPIMHGHGGVVLEHLKALSFHQDLRPGDVFTWYTTTGWMMWNYLAGGLLSGLTIVLYDGAATYPETDRLWQLTAEHGITYLGVGAPYLVACMKAGPAAGGGARPDGAARHRLDRVAAAAGGVRLGVRGGQAGPAARLLLGRHRHLHRLRRPVPAAAGALRDHLRALPGRRGGGLRRGRQAGHRPGRRAGAHPADAVDAGRLLERPRRRRGTGRATSTCTRAIWRHGDWIEMLPDGACVIYGRSDATLNRGGVRMGTSEFYRAVEAFDEVADSLVVDTGRLGARGG